MLDKDLSELIKKQIESGSSKSKIISDLIFSGWQYREIESAFEELFRSGEIKMDFWVSENEIKPKAALTRRGFTTVSGEIDAQAEPLSGISVLADFISRNKVLLVAFIFFCLGGILGWKHFYFDSAPVIIQKSINELSGVNSLGFSAKIKKEGNVISSAQGSFNFLTSSRSAQILKLNEGGGRWNLSFLQASTSSYLQINSSPEGALPDSFPLDKWILVDAQLQSLSSFVEAVNNFSLLASDSIIKTRDSFSNLRLYPQYFQELEKDENLNDQNFYQYKFKPSSDLSHFVFSKIDALTGFGLGLPSDFFGTWEILINKKDGLPYKIVIDQIENSSGFDSLEIDIGNYDYPFEISAPFEFIPLSNLIS